MRNLSKRQKLIAVGLYLARFDQEGLSQLGFRGFWEAFNTIALSLEASPAAIKNYRDEFDPFFPNSRKGWHKRPIRQYCKSLMDELSGLNIDEFTNLIKTEISTTGDLAIIEEIIDVDKSNSFAKRLVTGQAAEKFFEMKYHGLPYFQNHQLINTTFSGCGFDYKMIRDGEPFLAVEVKGLFEPKGAILLTSKEYKVANLLLDRYFLFVVRNFAESPFCSVIQNPIHSALKFKRRELIVVQESWSTAIE